MEDNLTPTQRKQELLRANQTTSPAWSENDPAPLPRPSQQKWEAMQLLIKLTDGEIPEAEIPQVEAQIQAAGLPLLPVETMPDGRRAIILHQLT